MYLNCGSILRSTLQNISTFLLIVFLAPALTGFAKGNGQSETGSGNTATVDHGLENLIQTEFATAEQIPSFQPFSRSSVDAGNLTHQVVSEVLVVETTADFQQLLSLRPANLRIELPLTPDLSVSLQLSSAVSPFASEYNLSESKSQTEDEQRLDPTSNAAQNSGLYYKGIVAGESPSLAAISFFETSIEPVIGVVSFGGSTYVIGQHEGKLIVYNDADMLIPNSASCSTEEPEGDFLNPALPSTESFVCRQTKVQFDCDYRLYTDKGSSVGNVENYVSGFFNVVQAVYLVDNFEIVISEILVFTTTDPYVGNTSSGGYLNQFRSEKIATGFNGNLAHLLSTRPLGLGGIAYLAGNLCSGNNRVCFSNISNGYNSFPFYSWTVDVTSHEMGHLLGSPHTHNCGWTGGAIDNCWGTEGSCSPGPSPPSSGGTIMSYCHLTSSGKDFSLGFADQPAALMQNYINLNTCFDPCSWSPPIGICASYCGSGAGSSANEWIESVSVGPLNNVSGNNGGFVDFGIASAEFTVGETYSINLQPGFSGSSSNEFFRVWMDFNRNGEFSGGSELVFEQLSTSGSTAGGTFTIPAVVDTGRIGLRVQMKKNSASGECENFALGEVEDYCVQLRVHPCPIPVNQTVDIASPTSATINWNNGYVGGYQIRGRKMGGVWSNFISVNPYKSYHAFRAGKTYEWQVSAICSDTTSPFSPIHTFTMPTARIALEGSIEILPNPASDVVTVRLSSFDEETDPGQELLLHIFNLNGMLVFEQKFSANERSILADVSAFHSGLYLIVVQHNGLRVQRKLTVLH